MPLFYDRIASVAGMTWHAGLITSPPRSNSAGSSASPTTRPADDQTGPLRGLDQV